MESIGLDLHNRESQLSSKADDGSITDRRIATSRERFTMDVVADADVRGGQFSSTKSRTARSRSRAAVALPGLVFPTCPPMRW